MPDSSSPGRGVVGGHPEGDDLELGEAGRHAEHLGVRGSPGQGWTNDEHEEIQVKTLELVTLPPCVGSYRSPPTSLSGCGKPG